MQTHTCTLSLQTAAAWMDGATGAVVNNTHTHTCKLSLLPLSLRFLLFAHSRVPLSSHHSLYSKLPSSFPLSFPLLLCPNTLRHLFSHSIMLLLDAFPPLSLSFNHNHFPCTLFSFFPPIFLQLFPPNWPLIIHIPNFPPHFSLLFLVFSCLFIPLLLPPSLAVVSYLSLWRRHSGIYESSLSNSS